MSDINSSNINSTAESVLDSIPSYNLSDLTSQMDLTWKCILGQYQTKAAECSKEFGNGISCFMMLKSPKEDTNCKLCYGARNDEGPWKTFVLNAPNKKSFLEKYDHRENYAICVTIPMGESLLTSIKLFRFDTGEEITLPKEDLEENE